MAPNERSVPRTINIGALGSQDADLCSDSLTHSECASPCCWLVSTSSYSMSTLRSAVHANRLAAPEPHLKAGHNPQPVGVPWD
jgi:hypothetical protein